MIFQVAEECRRLGLRAGAVVFRGVRVEPRGAALQTEILAEMRRLPARFSDRHAVRATPELTGFYEILNKAGVATKKIQPSVEKLLSYCLRQGDLPAINSLVDAYNLLSIRSLCSLGAHDLDHIALPATLRLLTGTETFVPLGRPEQQAVTPGEFGYADAADRVLCRLDILQADFSKVTTATSNVLLIIEGTAAHADHVLHQTCAEAMELIVRHCGGTAEIVAVP